MSRDLANRPTCLGVGGVMGAWWSADLNLITMGSIGLCAES